MKFSKRVTKNIERNAIGNSIGSVVPNIMVTNIVFIRYEYLTCIKNSGPEYNSMYYCRDVQLVNPFLENFLSLYLIKALTAIRERSVIAGTNALMSIV